MKILQLFYLFFFLIGSAHSVKATNYYINSSVGKDSNKGTGPTQAWNSILPLTGIQFMPGDSVLFATGQHFTGMLLLVNVKGSFQHPVVISSFSYKGNPAKPVIDAGKALNAILIQDASFIKVVGIEVTGELPYQISNTAGKETMRCGILVEITRNEAFENIEFSDVVVHDVYFHAKGYTRSAAETKSANGTQQYGWGIRFINNTEKGQLTGVTVLKTKIFNVSHTGLKVTGTSNGIKQVTVAHCTIYETGGPGMQFSGVTDGHIHDNIIHHSGSASDSRNWARGSGFWTWGCNNILIEHNRFENANGPGDSAGVHIDYNCRDIVVQYNFSANNAGGFCEILGNNFNCAYRYNISVNDGHRVKGVDGAFQEGKIFWLSGYQGEKKKPAGPFNSYFYNNSIYVAGNIVPKIAVSSSTNGVLIANNIFYFETQAQVVAGDQLKQEMDLNAVPNVVFKNNLFVHPENWPKNFPLQDKMPLSGDPVFPNKGGLKLEDYIPVNKQLVANRGISILPILNDSIGLRLGLKVEKDILGNLVKGRPGMGAIELNENN